MEKKVAPRARRTPQACATCRRRKTKCDGAHPRCRHCASRGIACDWPANPVFDPSHGDSESILDFPQFPAVADILSKTQLPEQKSLKRCFDIFFDCHFSENFCSFLYKPDLEQGLVEMPFLAIAIVSLCSRYLTPDEASEDFGLSSGAKVCRHFSHVARHLARSTSDEPSVQHIHGNLVLALSELLGNEGSSHWMYAGTAIRMAQIMRLNKEYHQNHSIKEREIRRRTLWACLIFDKMLAYFLTKPPTISMINVAIALPGTDAALAYQETSRGLTLGNLASFVGFPSEIGIMPYFIKTVCLWSDLVDFSTCNRRFIDKLPPTDQSSFLWQRQEAVQLWEASLPSSLAWTTEHYMSHASFGHGRDFVAMHFLLRSALCVAHQAYLPQLDGSSILLDMVDTAGLSLLHREPQIITICVSSALALGEIMEYLARCGPKSISHLRSTWVAASLLGVCNTYLWLQYANDIEYSSGGVAERARRYFELAIDLISSWTMEWKSARAWLQRLKAMHVMYRAAYLGEMDEPSFDEPAGVDSSSDDENRGRFRPQPGDGYPDPSAAPNLSATLRLLADDTSADPKMLQAMWMRFANGWPHDILNGLSTDDPLGLREFG